MAGEIEATPMISDALVILGAAGIVIPVFTRFRITPVIGFILIGIAAILAVYFSLRPASTTSDQPEGNLFVDSGEGKSIAQIREEQTPLAKRDLAGEEPPEEVQLAVHVEVDTTGGKNRLYLYITEAHGYYVETFTAQLWYHNDDEVTGPENSPLIVTHFINKYLKANDTLTDCLEIVPAELSRIGGDIGISDQWEARLLSFGRARLKNPDPLPRTSEMHRCD